MYYNVSIREKGKSAALESAMCGDDEIPQWCERAKQKANETGKSILVEFKPREQIFTFEPEKNRNENE